MTRHAMLLLVFVFIWVPCRHVTNAQEYSWDGTVGAGVSETFYRFGPQFDMTMAPGDDESTSKFELPTVFPFFGVDQTKVSVEMNGAIVFGDGVIHNVQYDLDFPFIAPFYSDIETLKNGQIYFRISNSPIDLERITATVKQSTTTKKGFSAYWCMVVTWYNVAEYDLEKHITNSFQAVLATDGENSFVLFNYGPVVWLQDAEAGFSPGRGDIFYELPLPGQKDAISIDEQCQPFGVGTYLFQVDANFTTLSCDGKGCNRGDCGYCCVCTKGFLGNGNTCFENNICAQQPCGVNGVCMANEDEFTCFCRDGYEGIKCEAPPISFLDNTFTGFGIRIRLTKPLFQEVDYSQGRNELLRHFDSVGTIIAARFGSPPFTNMRVLKLWEDTDGSIIADLQMVFSDVNGIDEEDVKDALISGFLQTGGTSINENWIQVKLYGDASDMNGLPFIGLVVGMSVLILILVITIIILSCLICRKPAPRLPAPSVYPPARAFPPIVARGRPGYFF